MKLLTSAFFILSALPSSISTQDEVSVLQELVETTKKNLEEQTLLLEDLTHFKDVRECFILDPTSPKLASKLVKAAMKLQTKIEKSQLAYLFSAEFLKEIQFFTSVGKEADVSLGE